jgi:hypothetical protein
MPKAKPRAALYQAISSGYVRIKGKTVAYYQNRTIVPAGDPLLRAVPQRFKALQLDEDIERATSTPAEVPET